MPLVPGTQLSVSTAPRATGPAIRLAAPTVIIEIPMTALPQLLTALEALMDAPVQGAAEFAAIRRADQDLDRRYRG